MTRLEDRRLLVHEVESAQRCGARLASESTFARVLREHGQSARRSRAKLPTSSRPPSTHIATAPRQVWCWDMTYLPATTAGRWFHLYLISLA